MNVYSPNCRIRKANVKENVVWRRAAAI